MDLLQQLIRIFAENGYVAVFIALMICGAGLPLPEDMTLVAGGVIAGLGYANVHAMFALAMFGVLLGDSAIFLLGHHYGARIMQWRFVARILTPSRYAKVQEKFGRYGNRMLFFARFLPGMRTTVYLTAGMTHRVSFARFLLLDTPGRADQRADLGVPGLFRRRQSPMADALDAPRPGQPLDSGRHRRCWCCWWPGGDIAVARAATRTESPHVAAPLPAGPFTLALLATLALASLLPCRGATAGVLGPRHRWRHRAAVLSARRQAAAHGDHAGADALAPAPDRFRQHLRAVSPARPGAAAARSCAC